VALENKIQFLIGLFEVDGPGEVISIISADLFRLRVVSTSLIESSRSHIGIGALGGRARFGGSGPASISKKVHGL